MTKRVSAEEWTRLQTLIFSRWVGQQIQKRHIQVKDVTQELGDGKLLVALMEELSERKFTGRINPNPRMRPQCIDNINAALKFTWECGVEMKIKPSAEDLADKKSSAILGFVWAIMLKFIKIGEDDDQSLNAKDALLLWVKNKTAGYKGVNVQDFTKSIQDGLALVAILHKHRPQVCDFDSLKKEDALGNIELAMNAADKYFNLEKYLVPTDIAKLDEKCMVVYIADYYYAIAEARKMDIAARRIGKVIKLTIDNDALRTKFNSQSKELTAQIGTVEKMLEDRTIDNTMSGAKERLEAFYKYKESEKSEVMGRQLDLEGVYNQLAMSLSRHQRPEYIPPEGCSLTDVKKTMLHLEQCETERQAALNAELNRQIKLVEIHNQHRSRVEKFQEWKALKETDLKRKESIHSIGEAILHLRLLDAFDREVVALSEAEGSVSELIKVGDYLEGEKYENLASVREAEKAVADDIDALKQLSVAKRPVLEDDLAREQYREKCRLADMQHTKQQAAIGAWKTEKAAYLSSHICAQGDGVQCLASDCDKSDKNVNIQCVGDAEAQLSLLESYQGEKVIKTETSVKALKALGQDLLGRKWDTQYSKWDYETPDALKAREKEVDDWWVNLDELAQKKQAVLDDHLARETFKESVRVMNLSHISKHDELMRWAKEKEDYLKTREEVDSIPAAQEHISLLDVFEKDKSTKSETEVTGLSNLGQDILKKLYQTDLSSYSFHNPSEISDREKAIGSRWDELAEASAEKRLVLDDHLARENFKQKVKFMNLQHVKNFDELMDWAKVQEAYLKDRETIDSIPEAETQLALLEAFREEKTSVTDTLVKNLKQQGANILQQEYKTSYTSYVFENPPEIAEREKGIEERWTQLEGFSTEKKKYLDDALALEKEKEETRLQFAHLAGEFVTWLKDKGETSKLEHFGFTLAEVEAYKKVLDDGRAKYMDEAGKKKAACGEVDTKLKDLKVTSNVYTKQTMDTLGDHVSGLEKDLDARDAKYSAELKRQQEYDALCKQFADLVDGLSRWISEEKGKISQAKAPLEDQLTHVEGKIASKGSDSSKLSEVDSLDQQLKDFGLTGEILALSHHIHPSSGNIHTTLGPRDIKVQFEQWGAFLDRKKKMLEEEIEHEKLRGITPEQFKEIEDNFNQFDANKSGDIDKKELRACLYSLGEEKKPQEIEKIMESFGKGGTMPFNGFKEFMIEIYGDTDTKEEIVAGFALLNKGHDFATLELLGLVMKEADVKYFKETAPAEGDNFNYKAWTDDVFSR